MAAVPKTREGYYHYTGGVEAAIKRELAFAPFADMIWLETKLPDLQQARYFSRKIREKYPGKCVSLIACMCELSTHTHADGSCTT